MLNSCILLITHNREDFVRRWLKFYSLNKTSVPIVIAASGSEASLNNIKEIKNQSKLDLTIYYHNKDIHLYQKIANTLNQLQYPIVAICADDDYILPQALLNAANFLENNLDYVSVSGYVFSVGRKPNEDNKSFEDELLISSYNQIPIQDNAAVNRLKKHFSEYTPTFYNTYRKEDLMRFFQEVYSATIGRPNNAFHNELFLSGLTIAKGKTYIQKELYMIRQGFNPISSSNFGFVPLEEFIKTRSFSIFSSKFYRRFKSLAKCSVKKSDIADAIISYVIRYMTPSYRETIINDKLEHTNDSNNNHFKYIAILLYNEFVAGNIYYKCLPYVYKTYEKILNSADLQNHNNTVYDDKNLAEFQNSDEFKLIGELLYNFPLGMPLSAISQQLAIA